MGIQINLPPMNFSSLLNNNLSSLQNLVKQELSILKQTKPLPIYDVQLSQELRSGNFNPKLTGWKYFILNNSEVVAMADIAVNERGEDPEFLYFTTGSYVGKILDKISEVESSPIVVSNPFEIRLLRISFGSLLAIWLHSSSQDLLYPIDEELARNAPYTFSQLFEQYLKEQINIIDTTGALTPSE